MMKHVHHVSNLANEDVNFVGMLDKTWSFFYGRVTLITFEFACNRSHSLGKNQSKKVSF